MSTATLFSKSGQQVHQVSHIDLDGYTCSYIARSFFKENNGHLFTQTNADYHELAEHLQSLLSRVNPKQPLDVLIITDLNLKKEEALVLVAFADRYNTLVLLDHHQNDMESINRLSSLEGVDFYPTLVQGKSGALLTWEFFHQEEELPAYVSITNTYDLYNQDDHWWETAYMFNEWFMAFRNDAKDVVDRRGLDDLLIRVIGCIAYLRPFEEMVEAISLFNHCENVYDVVSNYESLVESVYVLIYQSYTTEPMFFGTGTPENVCDLLNEKAPPQRQDLLLAVLSVSSIGIARGYCRSLNHPYLGQTLVLFSEKSLPRGVLYQLMYTLEMVGITVVLRQETEKGRRVELRQHKNKEYLRLCDFAAVHGGGGHIGAAGCHVNMGLEELVTSFRQFAQSKEVTVLGP